MFQASRFSFFASLLLIVGDVVVRPTIKCLTSIDKISTHFWSLSMLAWMLGEVWREEEKVGAGENKIVGFSQWSFA